MRAILKQERRRGRRGRRKGGEGEGEINTYEDQRKEERGDKNTTGRGQQEDRKTTGNRIRAREYQY